MAASVRGVSVVVIIVGGMGLEVDRRVGRSNTPTGFQCVQFRKGFFPIDSCCLVHGFGIQAHHFSTISVLG